MQLSGFRSAQHSRFPSSRSSASKPAVSKPRSARSQANATTTEAFDIKSKIQFLEEDLQHLFDDRGIDPTAYEPVVDFVDPITKYSSLDGYLFNIKFLKKAFNPKFFLHDSWASSDTAVTTRWTMVMEFSLTKGLPGIGKLFKPTIIFTGTSTYVFNPASGKIFRHIDTWDSISDQKFFSFEGFLDFLTQLFQPYSTPSLETPEYVVLKRTKDYQIRRYEPFLVAECREDRTEASSSSSGSGGGGDAAGGQAGSVNPGMQAFQALAGYIFGRNQRGEVMKMTTPVYNDSRGVMQFVIGASAHQDLSTLPAPVSPLVTTGTRPGSICAVRTFNGTVTPRSSEPELQALRRSLERDGLRPAAADWTLARYNDPGTPSFFRRNEVLVPLDEASFRASWP